MAVKAITVCPLPLSPPIAMDTMDDDLLFNPSQFTTSPSLQLESTQHIECVAKFHFGIIINRTAK